MPITIPLTQHKQSLIDEIDADLAAHKWHYRGGRINKAVRSTFADGRRDKEWLHRVIAERKFGAIPPELHVDHANRNPLDNRRCNIRLATRTENARNCGPHKRRNGSSQYKGVSLFRPTGKWRAEIRVDTPKGKRSLHLGYFASEVEAAKAYDDAARQHHGEFAYLNFR